MASENSTTISYNHIFNKGQGDEKSIPTGASFDKVINAKAESGSDIFTLADFYNNYEAMKSNTYFILISNSDPGISSDNPYKYIWLDTSIGQTE